MTLVVFRVGWFMHLYIFTSNIPGVLVYPSKSFCMDIHTGLMESALENRCLILQLKKGFAYMQTWLLIGI